MIQGNAQFDYEVHRPEGRDWMVWARCRGFDTSVFFPQKDEGRGPVAGAEAAAKKICRTCPVIAECRDQALLNDESHGIWGGMNYAERRAVVRARKLGRLQPV
ncbi:WhiB family transcriptional regulator [Rhodococcus chondri]|uniref:Transcriptional regulator WhiB n=1 Tax=Rhodococcus chondri TaxID=3065941 RepID=A0ABU7JZ35_9NOCA|nr:WhiB family transcriptional regulator [Rhodococcus sp. CC-R104]MEE2034829.1 WhiB family transcriptional regulator [Rhodococcus sp. CC-R104]